MTKKLTNMEPKILPINHNSNILIIIQEKVYIFVAVGCMEIA
jgi:hypothetical protein